MSIDSIDRAFRELLSRSNIHRSLGITSNYTAQLRYKLNHGIRVSTDLKIRLLQRSGWNNPQAGFTKKDLVAAMKYACKSNTHARDQGFEYLVEKFLKTKRI